MDVTNLIEGKGIKAKCEICGDRFYAESERKAREILKEHIHSAHRRRTDPDPEDAETD